jgi:uncharacterized pyridoxamine 5'-phosphate oxidase family protein
MSDILIPERLKEILENADWICLASRNENGDPNTANKFLLKCEESCVFIVDFVKGKTLENIRNYPKVSFSIMDLNNLVDYQLFGEVEIIENGQIRNGLLTTFEQRHTRFSTNRIIEGIRRSKKFNNNELPDISKAVIFKIFIKDIVVRGPRIEIKKH